MTKSKKVFGIGLNKTGTSSLGYALRHLGYRVSGSNRDLLNRVRRGDVASVLAWTERYDAFQDWPYPFVYRECFEKYGDRALFVLTVRSSPRRWFRSVERHARGSRLFRGQNASYGYYRPFGREREYFSFYEAHNAAVRSFFRDRNTTHRLLEVCWENGDGWKELCAFLGEPVPDAPFPHRGRTDLGKRPWRYLLNGFVEPAYRAYVRLTELLAN